MVPTCNDDTIYGGIHEQAKTMIILGSGGHTTEMMRLLEELDPKCYAPVSYVVANSDVTSIPRLKNYIQQRQKEETDHNRIRNGPQMQMRKRWEGRFPNESTAEDDNQRIQFNTTTTTAAIHRLPRVREVHQSYLSSILATLHAFFVSLLLVWKIRPRLVLANGPGTCVPVIFSAFALRTLLLGSYQCRVVYVESLCRVQTLSLTGRLVYPIVDRFVVHWPSLKERYPSVQVCDVFVRHDDFVQDD